MTTTLKILTSVSFIFYQTFSFSASFQEVKTPIKLDNPFVAPFELTFSPPLTNGDELVVSTGDKVILKASIVGSVNVDKLFAMYKSISNKTNFLIKRNGEISDKTFVNISLPNGAAGLIDTATEKGTRCLTKREDNQLRFLCRSEMSTTDYIRKIEITDSKSSVILEATPYMSSNPLFKLSGNFNSEELVVKAYIATDTFLDTGGVENTPLMAANVDGPENESTHKNTVSGWKKAN